MTMAVTVGFGAGFVDERAIGVVRADGALRHLLDQAFLAAVFTIEVFGFGADAAQQLALFATTGTMKLVDRHGVSSC